MGLVGLTQGLASSLVRIGECPIACVLLWHSADNVHSAIPSASPVHLLRPPAHPSARPRTHPPALAPARPPALPPSCPPLPPVHPLHPSTPPHSLSLGTIVLCCTHQGFLSPAPSFTIFPHELETPTKGDKWRSFGYLSTSWVKEKRIEDGTSVMLQSLKTAKYNGCTGIVVTANPEDERVVVAL